MQKRMRALLLSATMLSTLSGCTLIPKPQFKDINVRIEHTTEPKKTTKPKEETTITQYSTEFKKETTTEPKKEDSVEYYNPEETLIKSIKKRDVVITYYEDPENNTIQSIRNNGEHEVSEIGPNNEEYLLPGNSMLEFWKNTVVKTASNSSLEENYDETGKKIRYLNKKGLEESLYEYYEDNGAIKSIIYYKIGINQGHITRTKIMEDHYYDKNNSSNYYSEDWNLNEYEIYENNGLMFTCPLTYSVRVIDLYEVPHLIAKDESGNTVYTTLKWEHQTEFEDSKSIYPVSRKKTISYK